MAGYRARGGQNRSNNANSKNRPSGNAEASRQTAGNRQPKQPPRERSGRSSGARPAAGREPRGEREFAPGEFFTLGEHTVGRRRYRFRYNGKVYRVMEGLAQPKPPAAETDSTSVVKPGIPLNRWMSASGRGIFSPFTARHTRICPDTAPRRT